MGDKGKLLWIKLLQSDWRQFIPRLIAAGLLLDQWAGPVGGIPSSEAVVVVCLGALFAPLPSGERKR